MADENDAAPTTTAEDVADWMASEFKDRGALYQRDAADGIQIRFGSAFLYANEGGNPAIDRRVLAAFRRLSEDAIWDRWELCWRRRGPGDPAGRMAG
jgi:hypothetical protein